MKLSPGNRIFTSIAALWCFCACAAPSHDVPPPGFVMTDWQKAHMPPTLDVRRKQVDAVKTGELRLVPTFSSCGVAWGTASVQADVVFEYRVAGTDEWKAAPKPVGFKETGDVRGSLLYLREDTAYEMRVKENGRTVSSGSFRTWAGKVPVARTVVLDPATVKYPVRISEKGTPDGWVRYTVPVGKVLGGSDVTGRIVTIDGAENVILDGVTFEGGGGADNGPLAIVDSRGVRILNCEFHGWGRTGPQSFEMYRKNRYGGGKYMDMKRSKPGSPRFINYDAAIFVGRGASETVIERCYMHDPRGRANSWLYSHPAGPAAVVMAHPDHSCVIRYCDFVGSDSHWFNDAVEGYGNFVADGGFNRDADVYGNFMIYCNDDNIELDGGQQNVRCYHNRFEGALCGVSIQGCCASPVYVMDNLFSGMGEEFGFVNASIKTSTYDPWWYAPYAAVWRNIYQDRGDFCVKSGATSRWDLRDNVRDVDPSQETLSRFPVRPAGFILDRGRISGVAVKGLAAVPSAVEVTARSTSSSPVPFRVCKGFDSGWYTVAPASGTIPAGGEVRLRVTFDARKMAGRRHWRSAFTVRTPEGLSRCVSVVGERTDYEIPSEPLPPSESTVYAAPVAENGETVFTFDLKKPGRYWFFVRAQGDPASYPRPSVSIDGSEYEPSAMRLWKDYPAWALIRPGHGSRLGEITRHFDLKAGRHTLRVRPRKGERFTMQGAAVTASPEPFAARGTGAAFPVR